MRLCMSLRRLLWLAATLLVVGPYPASAQQQPPAVEHVARGNHFVQQGRLDLAIEEYEKARQAGAGSAAFLNRLGQMYLDTGAAAQGRGAFRASLQDKPSQILVMQKIGDTFLAEGQLDSALAQVALARDLPAANEPVSGSRLQAQMGMMYLHAGMPDRARAHIDTALTLNPDNPDAYRFRAVYHTQRESVDAALADLGKVIEFLPDDMEAHNNIGYLHAAAGRFGSALEFYARTKELTRDPHLNHAINLRMEAIRAIMDGKMRARYILVGSETEAKRLVEKLAAGTEFGALAQEYSKAPNAPDGGDLGFFGPGELLEPIEQAVLQLEVGEVSGLVPVEMGLVIIQRLN